MIFTYVPHGAEADISAFNREAERQGCAVAYPVCLGGGIMVAAQPLAPDAWEAGPYGIPSPRLSRSHIVAPEDIRLALVPCAAFDRQCRRVGSPGTVAHGEDRPGHRLRHRVGPVVGRGGAVQIDHV